MERAEAPGQGQRGRVSDVPRATERGQRRRSESRRIGNVVIVERATDPLAPYGVRKLTLLGIAFALIVCAALAWITIAEFFDHGVYTAATLQEQVDAPVLAVVPSSRTAQLRRLSRRTPTFESIG
jgi:capsular polysaccharide biosynthesis protein